MSEQLLLDVTDKMADVRAKMAKFVFSVGVEMIVAQGIKEASARSLLGKKLKEIGKPALLRVIIAAALNEVADPRTYIAAAKPGGPSASAAQRSEPEEDHRAGIQPWMG